MRNEAADIVQDQPEEMKEAVNEWKDKARAAGTAAWDATRATCQQIQETTSQYSKAADKVIREKPYTALGIAFGAGLLLSLLMTKSNRSEQDTCC